MVNFRNFAISDQTFSHFTTKVDIDEVENIDDVIKIVSPNPNKINPNVKYRNVDNFGFKLRGLYELHDKKGISLIVKISLKIGIINFFVFYLLRSLRLLQ